jgi:hypothetical protein
MDDRAFLSALVGQVVAVDGIIEKHLMVEVHERDRSIAVTIVRHVLVTTLSGRQLVDHLGVKNANQLRPYPTGTRLKFCAVVRPYVRANGTQSWGLSGPHSIELVAVPPALRPAQQEEVSK